MQLFLLVCSPERCPMSTTCLGFPVFSCIHSAPRVFCSAAWKYSSGGKVHSCSLTQDHCPSLFGELVFSYILSLVVSGGWVVKFVPVTPLFLCHHFGVQDSIPHTSLFFLGSKVCPFMSCPLGSRACWLFLEGSESKYFWPCRSCSLSCNHSALL